MHPKKEKNQQFPSFVVDNICIRMDDGGVYLKGDGRHEGVLFTAFLQQGGGWCIEFNVPLFTQLVEAAH